MENLLLDLESNKVIERKDILKLITYIEEKHPDKSIIYKADILADKINKIIDTSLHGCDSNEKEKIRLYLIDQYLIKENKPIDKLAVFNELLELDDYESKVVNRLTQWLAVEHSSEYSVTQLKQYLTENRIKEISTYSNDEQENIDSITPVEIKESSELVKTNSSKSFNLLKLIVPICILFISIAIYQIQNLRTTHSKHPTMSIMNIHETSQHKNFIIENTNSDIPYYLRYSNISKNKLVSYLDSKNSLLTLGNNIDTIYKLSDEYKINPLLLIAIIGQEQNFVPQNNKFASVIINNPYNVYGSWRQYNTDFEDSTRIALNTIHKCLSNNPDYIDPFKWLNQVYAEDEHWWRGVKIIFLKLREEVL